MRVCGAPRSPPAGTTTRAALSNPSHSPVWFIKDLGDAYRASGRTTPIFDQFDMHPYPPVQDTDPFSAPFQWPQAGAANLDRIKQALWDAFHRTGQPTVAEGLRVRSAGETPIPGLPINLDEAGEQTLVPAPEMPAYDGTAENVIAITEAEQALNHVELAEIAACDPTVSSLLYFPLIDDTSRSTGFQSGNLFADFAAKESYVGDEDEDRLRPRALPGRHAGDPGDVVALGARRRLARHLRRARHEPGVAACSTACLGARLVVQRHGRRGRHLSRGPLAGHRDGGLAAAGACLERTPSRLCEADREVQPAAAAARLLPVQHHPDRGHEPGADDQAAVEALQGRRRASRRREGHRTSGGAARVNEFRTDLTERTPVR